MTLLNGEAVIGSPHNTCGVGGLQSSPDVRNQQRTEHIQQPAWAVNVAFTCSFYENEGARASCQHLTLRNCGGLPASTTTVKNANDLLEQPTQAFT